MIKTHETDTHTYFIDYFDGTQVKIMKNKKTGEILFDAESVAKILGYGSMQGMMSDDNVLDLVNELKRDTGKFPIIKLEP